jgi:hypothetical protein
MSATISWIIFDDIAGEDHLSRIRGEPSPIAEEIRHGQG